MKRLSEPINIEAPDEAGPQDLMVKADLATRQRHSLPVYVVDVPFVLPQPKSLVEVLSHWTKVVN